MKPWIDRQILVDQAKEFIKRNGYTLRANAKRIASLVEIAAYNSVVSFYESKGYTLTAQNLGPKKSFRYKVIATGLFENFSYFEAIDEETDTTVCIFHNTKIQSAHHAHLYYTPDVAVCDKKGAITTTLKNKRKHSYIANEYLLTFIEVKHLVPFPEALFSYTGLVLEFQPGFISGGRTPSRLGIHLTPMIVFTGVSSAHVEMIRNDLSERYGINIVFGTQKKHGQIADFADLKKYNHSPTRQSRRR